MSGQYCTFYDDFGSVSYYCDYGCCESETGVGRCCDPFFTPPVIVAFVIGAVVLSGIFCIMIGFICRNDRRQKSQRRLLEHLQLSNNNLTFQNNICEHERPQEVIFNTRTTMTYPATYNQVNDDSSGNCRVEDDAIVPDYNSPGNCPPSYEDVYEENDLDTTRIINT